MIDAATHDVYGGVSKGAYVLEDAANPQVMLIGTGSEVWPCVDAAKLLAARGNCRARGEHAKLEDFRRAVGRVQGERAAGGRAEAGCGSGRYAGLVEVRGTGRRCDRARSLWRVGAGAEGDGGIGFTAENVAARAKALVEVRVDREVGSRE